MDAPRLALRASVVLSAGFLLALLVLAASHRGGSVTAEPLRDASGAPLAVPTQAGHTAATWEGVPVLVFVTTAKELAGVDAARGAGSATPAIAVPGQPDLRLFVLSAKSTHLGCIVVWNAGLGASRDVADYDGDSVPDGRILDPCHLGQWDAFHRGAPQPGGPAPARLAQLDARIVDGHLEATGFDGAVGPAPR